MTRLLRLLLALPTALFAQEPKRDTVAKVEAVTVSATRTERRVEDVPLRVEVLPREEIEEKLLMTPGDITMMLAETGGLRVQTTSPSFGGANVRVQGLRGRYTMILSDGLPLYGAQVGGLGMLQIPPMDLGQVEVIKGVASALYGSSALGGVINLVSRRPGRELEHEALVNRTSRGGSDATLWSSGPVIGGWGYTMLASGHHQPMVDVDADGWADMAGYARLVARPRLFWRGSNGRNAFVTFGTTLENREGGTFDGDTVPNGLPFQERLRTRRFDAGAVLRLPMSGSRILSLRTSATRLDQRQEWPLYVEPRRQDTWFSEGSLSAARGIYSGVVGAAVTAEKLVIDSRASGFGYQRAIPSVFFQLDADPTRRFALSASARVDHLTKHGTFVSPRLSALTRWAESWSARLSAGTGLFAPTWQIEELEATGPYGSGVSTDNDRPERAAGVSLDVGGTAGPLELSAAAFASRIKGPLMLFEDFTYAIANSSHPTRTAGFDLLARYIFHERLRTTATYTFVHATEENPETRLRDRAALVPRHAAGLVSVWEVEGLQRIGLELYYTGRQRLHDNPYLTESPAYVIVGAIAERRIGRTRVFLNLENLGDVRMTKYQPLVRPTAGTLGRRWTTDAWGPLEGRTVNGGLRFEI